MQNLIVYFFYNDDCPHCHKILPLIKSLKRKYTNVDFQILEVHYNKLNRKKFNTLNRSLGNPPTIVPEVIVGNRILLGSEEIPAKLEDTIKEMKK